MKVLTATSETQGRRENDFCWTVEGELVYFAPIECGRGSVDDDCGCRRSMVGLSSERATTTMKLAERDDIDPETYSELIADACKAQGHVTDELMAMSDVREWPGSMIEDLVYLAEPWPVGTVVERRGDLIQVRGRSEDPT